MAKRKRTDERTRTEGEIQSVQLTEGDFIINLIKADDPRQENIKKHEWERL